MQSVAIVCFVLAGVSAIAAINNVIGGVDREGVAAVGYVVGLFLLPVIFLIGGLAVWRKAKTE